MYGMGQPDTDFRAAFRALCAAWVGAANNQAEQPQPGGMLTAEASTSAAAGEAVLLSGASAAGGA
jgi:hypothetical protein